MLNFTGLASVPSHPLALFTDRLRLAVAAYLARFMGSSREHIGSDPRCYLAWCASSGLAPHWAPAQGSTRPGPRPRCRAARVGRPAGTCRSRDDLLAELADVIIAAAMAMSGITGDVDEARSHLEWRA